MSNTQQGRFIWYDLMTSNAAAAQAFYSEVIGWKTEAWSSESTDPSKPPYVMWKAGDIPMGGVMTLPEAAKNMGAPPHWLAYIKVDDIDATTARAAELGATIISPIQNIPEVGSFSIIADPQNAVIALFAPTQDMRTPEGPGRIAWNELASDDAEGAWNFYSALLGWTETDTMDMGPMGTYQMFGVEGATPEPQNTIGAMFPKPEEIPVSAWLYYINVDGLQSAIDRVTSHGGQVLNGPMEVPGGDVIAQCLDPEGVPFALHSASL